VTREDRSDIGLLSILLLVLALMVPAHRAPIVECTYRAMITTHADGWQTTREGACKSWRVS